MTSIDTTPNQTATSIETGRATAIHPAEVYALQRIAAERLQEWIPCLYETEDMTTAARDWIKDVWPDSEIHLWRLNHLFAPSRPAWLFPAVMTVGRLLPA